MFKVYIHSPKPLYTYILQNQKEQYRCDLPMIVVGQNRKVPACAGPSGGVKLGCIKKTRSPESL